MHFILFMKTELRLTEDGSHTLFVPSLNEHYHSVHGAVQESTHVFIRAGLDYCRKNPISVLEVGFGTGLNALLTFIYATEKNLRINYHSLELNILGPEIYKNLNYPQLFPGYQNIFFQLHESDWEKPCEISPYFSLSKTECNLLDFNDFTKYDVIFFDAFGPDFQPALWHEDIFKKLYGCLNGNGILTTYSAKGNVKRALMQAGFTVTKLAGPPGKREMIRAEKII